MIGTPEPWISRQRGLLIGYKPVYPIITQGLPFLIVSLFILFVGRPSVHVCTPEIPIYDFTENKT